MSPQHSLWCRRPTGNIWLLYHGPVVKNRFWNTPMGHRRGRGRLRPGHGLRLDYSSEAGRALKLCWNPINQSQIKDLSARPVFNRGTQSQKSHKGFPLVLTIQKTAGANLTSEVFKVTVGPGLSRAKQLRQEIWRGTTRYSSGTQYLRDWEKGQTHLTKADWQFLYYLTFY